MPDGALLSSQRQREVAWIDDDDLVSGAAGLAKFQTSVCVEFLPPINVTEDRKTLAAKIRQNMLAAYAAAPKRAV